MSALQTQIAGSGKDIPVILLAERIEENALVEAASHGVRAIALRNRPAHLLALVRSEWNDLQARRGLRRIEAQMRETERRCDALIASSRDPIAYVHEACTSAPMTPIWKCSASSRSTMSKASRCWT